MNNEFLRLAIRVTRPISLASVALIVLYGVYRMVLGMDVFSVLNPNNTFLLIDSIADYVFRVVLVVAVLGIMSFTIINFYRYRATSSHTEQIIRGNVFFPSGKPVKGATVFVEGIDRRRETDDNGWFSMSVDDQDSWVVHALYEHRTAEIEVGKDQASKAIRITLSEEDIDENELSDRLPFSQSLVTEDPLSQPLQNPVPLLRHIKQHLSKQPSKRGYMNPIVSAITPLCHDNVETATRVFQILIQEGYIDSVVGNRYELSLKAHNVLGKGEA